MIKKIEKCDKKTLSLLFVTIFLRTVVIAPSNVLWDLYSDFLKTPPKADSIIFLASFTVFSIVAAFAVTVTIKHNSLVKLPLFFILLDPVFSFLSYSFAMYVLAAVSIIIFMLLTNDHYISAGLIALPIFSLICTVLSREYALSFVLVLIMVGILLAFENDTLRKKIVISVSAAIAALIVGVIVNTILINSGLTKAISDVIPYTTALVKENHELYEGVDNISKTIVYVLASIIPGIAFSIAVLMFARKCGRKIKNSKNEKDNLYGMHIMVLLCILISVAGTLFLSEDAGCLIGIVTPVAVLTVCLTKKPSVTASLMQIAQFVKKYYALCLCGMFLIEIPCYILTYRYYICNRILEMVKTII